LPVAGSRTNRSVAVVDLGFFSRSCGDDRPGFDGGLLSKARDEAPDARIGHREAMVIA